MSCRDAIRALGARTGGLLIGPGSAMRQKGIKAKKSGKKKRDVSAASSAIEEGTSRVASHAARLFALNALKSMIVADMPLAW